MRIDDADRRLLAAIEDGLPLTPQPYAAIARHIGLSEADVLARLHRLRADGIISRFGLVVRHRELGYRANAMVVWDIPDGQADEAGRRLAAYDFITLCYRRPRRLPLWPYNLFCMVHGRDRDTVRGQIATLNAEQRLDAFPHDVLFSRRRFKQRGARYAMKGAA
ncbi:MAG: siroheme decarboxylase subunit beta [Alphaproteobacteria bacterium]